MKRWQVAAGAVGMLGLAAGVFGWREHARTIVTVQAADRANAQPHAAAANGPDGATAQRAASYELDYAFAMTAPFVAGVDAELTLHVTGALHLGAARTDGQAQWLPARLQQATVTQNAAASQVLDLPKLHPEADLEKPFAIHVTADGRVDEVRCDPATSFAARSTLAAAAWAMQRARPATPRATTWQTEEHDANGTYVAQYKQTADGALEKSWTVGQGTDSPSRLAQVSDGRAHFTLRGQALEALDYSLSGKAATGTLNVATYKPFSVRLSLKRQGDADDAWSAALQPQKLTGFTSASAAVRHRTELPTRAFEAVFDDVLAKSGHLDPGGHTNLRNELTHALALQPGTVAKLEAQLRAGALTGEAARLAVEALVGARTDEAQERVAKLFSDESLPLVLRNDLLTAAALMSRPNVAFVTSLEQLAYNPGASKLSASAATTLGASAAFLAEKQPAAAAEVIRRMVDNAGPVLTRHTHHEPEPFAVRQAWLAGLGNTGDATALPLILSALNDRSELVRGAAALALRRQDPAACVGPMVDRMAVESSAHVRENLVDAARFLGPGKLEEFVEKALRFDHSEHVRLAAAYAMASWSTAAPGLRKVLVDALKHEKSPKVAEALQNYINQGHVSDGASVAPAKMGQLFGAGTAP